MADEQLPFADVRRLADGSFSLPQLKWRELLFIGALKPEGDVYVRDLSRPMPPFQAQDLFPPGVRFEAVRAGDRVVVRSRPASPQGSKS